MNKSVGLIFLKQSFKIYCQNLFLLENYSLDKASYLAIDTLCGKKVAHPVPQK